MLPLSVTVFILQRGHDIVGQVAQPAGHFVHALAHTLLDIVQIGCIKVNASRVTAAACNRTIVVIFNAIYN